jgi:hypothetical protein
LPRPRVFRMSSARQRSRQRDPCRTEIERVSSLHRSKPCRHMQQAPAPSSIFGRCRERQRDIRQAAAAPRGCVSHRPIMRRIEEFGWLHAVMPTSRVRSAPSARIARLGRNNGRREGACACAPALEGRGGPRRDRSRDQRIYQRMRRTASPPRSGYRQRHDVAVAGRMRLPVRCSGYATRLGMGDARAEHARRQMEGHSNLREHAGGRREGSGRPRRS